MLLHRAAAGQGGDPPRAGRHALLADDLEDADLAGVGQVRAAAKFLAEIADRNHADHVGILFAEEHRGAGLAGLGQRHVRRSRSARPPESCSFTSFSMRTSSSSLTADGLAKSNRSQSSSTFEPCCKACLPRCFCRA